MRSERVVILLIGTITGLLLVCGVAGLLLASTGDEATAVQATPPAAAAAVQADISEQYLNRTFLTSTSGFDSPVPITGGRLDVQPGNRIAFSADVDSPIGPLTATGTVTVAVQDNLLDISIESVRIGQLPATELMRLFRPDTEAEINAMANRMLLERAGQAGLELEAVMTDDTTLHVYLAGRN